MKSLLISAAVLAVMFAAGSADASPCRNAKGQFAKCGTPGAMPYEQFKAMKGKPAAAPMMKPAAAPMMKPAAAPMMKPAAAPAMKPAAAPMMAAAPAKKGPCKDAKGKFIKCK